MLNDCHKYDTANNAKIQPFPTEPLIMALLLSQHKMIDWLNDQIKLRQKWGIFAMSKEQQSQTKGNNKNNTELRF